MNSLLYKTVEETLQRYNFHVYQPRIAFHDQTGVFGVQLLAPGETDFWIQYFRRTLCALNKEGEQGEKCTPRRHWIWTLFWLRAVGTEADICEVIKISQIVRRQGDKQVPDRNDSSLPPPTSILCLNVTSTTPITRRDRCAQWRPDACSIRPFSRLRIFMPRYVRCGCRLLHWHEFWRIRMHRCSYKPHLGDGWKSFLPYCNWTAAMRHRQQHILRWNCRSNFCKEGNY